ncbi:unnamed protein product [Diplocarpon coronariae]
MAGTPKWTVEQKEACYAAKDRGLSNAQVALELNSMFPRCGKFFDESAVKYALGLRVKGSTLLFRTGNGSGRTTTPSMTPVTSMSHPSSAIPKLSRLATNTLACNPTAGMDRKYSLLQQVSAPKASQNPSMPVLNSAPNAKSANMTARSRRAKDIGITAVAQRVPACANQLQSLLVEDWSPPLAEFEPIGQQQVGLNTAPNPVYIQAPQDNDSSHAQADFKHMHQQRVGLSTAPHLTYKEAPENNGLFYPPPDINQMCGYQQQQYRRAHFPLIPRYLPRNAPNAGLLGTDLAGSHSVEGFAKSIFEPQLPRSMPWNKPGTSANWDYNQLAGDMQEGLFPNAQVSVQGIYAAPSYSNPRDGTTFQPTSLSLSDQRQSISRGGSFQKYGLGTFPYPNSGPISGPPVGVYAAKSRYPPHGQRASRVTMGPVYGQRSDFGRTSLLLSPARQTHFPRPAGPSDPLSTPRTGNPADISLSPPNMLRCTNAVSKKGDPIADLTGNHASEEVHTTDPLKNATDKSNLKIDAFLEYKDYTIPAIPILGPSVPNSGRQLLPEQSSFPESAPPTLELTRPIDTASRTPPASTSRHIPPVNLHQPDLLQIEPLAQAVSADISAAVFASGKRPSSAPAHHTAVKEPLNKLLMKRKGDERQIQTSGATESPAKKKRIADDLEAKSHEAKGELLLRQAGSDLQSSGQDVLPSEMPEFDDSMLKGFESAREVPALVYSPSDAILAQHYNSEIYKGLVVWRDLSVKCEERSYIPCGPSLDKGGHELAEAVADGTFRELIGRKLAEHEAEMKKIREDEAQAYRHRMDGTKTWPDFGYFGPARYASPDTYRNLFR